MISYHWELLLDNIGGGRGREGIIGDKAAPESAVTEIKLVYEEGGGGCVLWGYLFGIILKRYGFVFDS